MTNKKAGRPKGSANKENKQVEALKEEIKLLEDDIETYEDNQEKVKSVIDRMLDFQEKALGFLFVLAMVMSIFNFLG